MFYFVQVDQRNKNAHSFTAFKDGETKKRVNGAGAASWNYTVEKRFMEMATISNTKHTTSVGLYVYDLIHLIITQKTTSDYCLGSNSGMFNAHS